MNRKTMVLGLFLLLGIGLMVGYTGLRIAHSRAENTCDVCGRPLHARSKVVATVGDQRQTFCCAACALRAGEQSGHPTEIVEVTDFASGRSVAPRNSVFVVGSNMNLCTHHQTLLDQAKDPSALEFDRCSPSIFAFADRSEAEAFTEEKGGMLMTLDQLRAGYR